MSTDLHDQLAMLFADDDRLIRPVTPDEAVRRASVPASSESTSSSAARPVAVAWTGAGRRDDRGARRPRVLWSVVAVATVVATLAGIVLLRDGDQRGATSPGETIPVEVTPVRAQDELSRLVREVLVQLGWPVEVPRDVTASRSGSSGAERFAEVRLAPPGRGELLVSIDTGDAEAAAIGSTDREVVRVSGTASVYLGTDSDTARAVELIDGTTIIYVRSESTAQGQTQAPTPAQTPAQSLDDLATIALALNAAWSPDLLAFDAGDLDDAPPATVFVTVPVSDPAELVAATTRPSR